MSLFSREGGEILPEHRLLAAVAALLVLAALLGRSYLTGRFPFGDVPMQGAAAAAILTAPEQEALYAPGDPWRTYLADEVTCPGGEDVRAPLAAQVRTMLCLVDFARKRAGVPQLRVSETLSRSAWQKGNDIVGCGEFAHGPCGGDPGKAVRDLGYDGAFGENLYIAEGLFAAPRVALDQWLNSESHRENLLHPQWRVQSLSVVKVGPFREYGDATLWVSHFGDR